METFTDKEKIDALIYARRHLKRYFKSSGKSQGVCRALPNTPVGEYLQNYIGGDLLPQHAYVTSWVIQEVYGDEWKAEDAVGRRDNTFWQEQYHLYRIRWINHIINQIKEG